MENQIDIVPEDQTALNEATAENISENDFIPQQQDESEVPEMMKADPDIFFVKWKKVVEDNGLSFAELLNELGFDSKQVQLVFTKTIPEAIATINRRLALEIFRMGEITKTPTDVIRASLGSGGTSEEWLELMDDLILPYVGYFKKHGKVDEDFYMKNKEGLYITDEEGRKLKEPQVERPTEDTEVEEEQKTDKKEEANAIASAVKDIMSELVEE